MGKFVGKRSPAGFPRRTPSARIGQSFEYRDPKYGFSLRLPGWWRDYISLRRDTRLSDAEYAVHFLFKYQGKTYGEALSLLVFRMTRKQWVELGYEDSPFFFLAERNGRIFAYTVPGELPSEFLNETLDDYDYVKYGRPIGLLVRMVEKDVPNIVKTLRFDSK